MSFLLIFLAGIFEGFMDVLNFHWTKFKKKHKNAKDKFWNSEYSWLNKYNQFMKPKFFGSTTFLVFTTDAWHLFKWLRNLSLFAAFYFLIDIWYLAPLLYMINRIGFVLIFNWIYK